MAGEEANVMNMIMWVVIATIAIVGITVFANYFGKYRDSRAERIRRRDDFTTEGLTVMSVSQNSERTGFVGTGTWIALIIIAIIGLGAATVLGIDVGAFLIPVVAILVAVFFATGIRIVRPTHRAIIERLGKFQRVQKQGITWIVPFVDKSYMVNITEQMTDAEKQEVITKDNLNASIAALIRFKVMEDDDNVKLSQYSVNDYRYQIVQLARTTLRNVIGSKDFKDVNSERNKLNVELKTLIEAETKKWGIEVVSFEMKEIEPPKDVQETMNKVIKAANEKQAAVDFATAVETQADGEKRAAIKKAEGKKDAQKLEAEGKKEALRLEAEGEASAITAVAEAKAQAIEKVNTAAKNFFKEGAIEYRRLEVTENALKDNTKYVITQEGISPSIILPTADNNGKGGGDGITPIPDASRSASSTRRN